MKKVILTLLVAIGIVIVPMAIMAACLGYLVQSTWNYVMPSIFDITQISYVQACALTFLTSLLIGTPVSLAAYCTVLKMRKEMFKEFLDDFYHS